MTHRPKPGTYTKVIICTCRRLNSLQYCILCQKNTKRWKNSWAGLWRHTHLQMNVWRFAFRTAVKHCLRWLARNMKRNLCVFPSVNHRANLKPLKRVLWFLHRRSKMSYFQSYFAFFFWKITIEFQKAVPYVLCYEWKSAETTVVLGNLWVTVGTYEHVKKEKHYGCVAPIHPKRSSRKSFTRGYVESFEKLLQRREVYSKNFVEKANFWGTNTSWLILISDDLNTLKESRIFSNASSTKQTIHKLYTGFKH